MRFSQDDAKRTLARAAECFQLGRYQDAIRLSRRSIVLESNSVQARHVIGASLVRLGRPREAIEWLTQALELSPSDDQCWSTLGLAVQGSQGAEASIPYFERACVLSPDNAALIDNLANAYRLAGRSDEAVNCLVLAIETNPKPNLFRTLGIVLAGAGLRAQAADAFAQAMQLDPSDAESRNAIGVLLMEEGRCEDAATWFEEAHRLAPHSSEPLKNCGHAFLGRSRTTEAISCYKRAAELGDPEAAFQLGHCFAQQGAEEEASWWFDRTVELDPERRNGCLWSRALAAPPILDSAEQALKVRSNALLALGTLGQASLTDPLVEVAATDFLFAFQGFEDRSFKERLAQAYRCACPDLSFGNSVAPPSNSRLRVGLLSAFFRNHTIGKLTEGFLRHLDRERFETVLIRTPGRRDEESVRLEGLADQVVYLPTDLFASQQALASQSLDALFLPEIGIDPQTYFLAFARSATLQFTTWGHPVTSGIESIDAFLSSTLVEPENAQEHYSENLVQWPHLPVCYERPAEQALPSHDELGLIVGRRLYVCPQTLFKVHPCMDGVLADLLDRDRDAILVFIEGNESNWTERLRDRLSRACPDSADRIVFLKRLTSPEFLGLLAAADVLLDTLSFGAGNTAFEAFSLGVPMVTWPGATMRARVTDGCYRAMGWTELSVDSAEAYVEKAMAVASNPDYRRHCSEQIRERSDALFDRKDAVRSLEDWIVRTLDTRTISAA